MWRAALLQSAAGLKRASPKVQRQAWQFSSPCSWQQHADVAILPAGSVICKQAASAAYGEAGRSALDGLRRSMVQGTNPGGNEGLAGLVRRQQSLLRLGDQSNRTFRPLQNKLNAQSSSSSSSSSSTTMMRTVGGAGSMAGRSSGSTGDRILALAPLAAQRNVPPSLHTALSILRRKMATATVSSSLPTSAAAAAATAAGAASNLSRLPLVHGGRSAELAVASWLFGCSAWVFCLVVLGGVTRLTRSGLSMTDWKFTGEKTPVTDEDWEAEFAKYKNSPEYKRVNLGMSLPDFKFIFWMEYAHRMWGRALGLLFAGPALYFAARGNISRPLAGRLAVLFGLGGAQGLIGWWMVKSGLEEPKSQHDVPRVSPYRLAAHLTSAFVIFSGIFWTALTVLSPSPPAASAAQIAAAAKTRGGVHAAAAIVGLTALSGAFVAGNDAGHAFNTFPMMGDHWVPPEILELQPITRNFFENTATVQFQHRVLAITTLATVTSIWATARKLPLHPSSLLLLNAALGVTCLQVTLGISTLLTYVPVSLGSAHQAGALTLFSVFLALLHSLRRQPPAAAARTAAAAALKPTPAAAAAAASPPPSSVSASLSAARP